MRARLQRVLTGAGILVRLASLALPAYALHRAWQAFGGGPGRGESLYWLQLETLAVFPLFAWFVTRPERLPPESRVFVPRRRWVAWICAPFLPGGGRGMVLVLLHLFSRDWIAWFVSRQYTGSEGVDLQVLRRMWVLEGAGLILLAVPSGIASRWSDRRVVRIATLVLIVGTAALFVFPPDRLLGWRGLPGWLFWDYGPEPRLTLDHSAWGLDHPDPTYEQRWLAWQHVRDTIRAVLSVGCVAAFALNVPRMLGGLRELTREPASEPVREP